MQSFVGANKVYCGDVRMANWPAGTQVITFHQEAVSRQEITPTTLPLLS